MIRLIRLEFLKLRANRALWILLGLYILCLAVVALTGNFVLDYLAAKGISYRGLDPTMLPIYDFEDVWQNLAWLAYFFKIFPALLLIISITNEFQFNTHRQNIIDGLSRTGFFLSKLSFAAFLAILSGLAILVLGTILGLANASVVSAQAYFYSFFFVPVHAIQLFSYFLFAIFLALLIRKSAVTIVLLLLYTLILEPIISGVLGIWWPGAGAWFPLNAFSNIIPFPFGKYILLESPDFVSPANLAIALLWAGVLFYGISYQLRKRDF